MNIEIQATGIPTSRDVHHFVRCRADLALNVLRDQIGLVSVFVDKANESDGGNQIRCLVLIRSNALADVEVESTDTNLYVAIHKAVDDAGWTLASRLVCQQGDMLHRQLDMINDKHFESHLNEYVDSGRAA